MRRVFYYKIVLNPLFRKNKRETIEDPEELLLLQSEQTFLAGLHPLYDGGVDAFLAAAIPPFLCSSRDTLGIPPVTGEGNSPQSRHCIHYMMVV